MTILNSAFWNRHGDVTDGANDYRAETAVPTLVSEGLAVPPDQRASLASLMITHEAAGARSFTVTIYGYKPATYIMLAGVLTAIANSEGWAHAGEIEVTGAANAAETHLLEGTAGFTRLAAVVSLAVGAPDVWTDFGFSSANPKRG